MSAQRPGNQLQRLRRDPGFTASESQSVSSSSTRKESAAGRSRLQEEEVESLAWENGGAEGKLNEPEHGAQHRHHHETTARPQIVSHNVSYRAETGQHSDRETKEEELFSNDDTRETWADGGSSLPTSASAVSPSKQGLSSFHHGSQRSIKDSTHEMDQLRERMAQVVDEDRKRAAQFSSPVSGGFSSSYEQQRSKEGNEVAEQASALQGSFALATGIYLLQTVGRNIFSPEIQRRRLREMLTQGVEDVQPTISVKVVLCVRYSIKSHGVREQSKTLYTTESIPFDHQTLEWKGAQFVERLDDKDDWGDVNDLFFREGLAAGCTKAKGVSSI
eukprot:gb/GECG01003207.1/.p1 GENE.gb/GECG01003207.1/~~gb/GECG01003207.1/.p1  ORF type:complete len:332 (+),score=42.66 gb/GECG01003207.1/:1-996(+)